MRIAAVQMESQPLDVEGNLKRVQNWMSRAASQHANLVVFPECTLTGYALDAEETRALAEPVPGSRTEPLARLCRETELAIVVGTLEKGERDRCHNSAVLISPDGLLLVYRKTHLPGFGLDRSMTAGNCLDRVADLPAGRCGMLICYDLFFPEPARVLALAGAQVILAPVAWSHQASYYPDYVLRTRSAENGVYLVAADYVGRERELKYLGRSIITGPNGEVLAEASTDQEEMLVAELDLEKSDHKERIFEPDIDEIDLFGDRRPGLYGAIADETHSGAAL